MFNIEKLPEIEESVSLIDDSITDTGEQYHVTGANIKAAKDYYGEPQYGITIVKYTFDKSLSLDAVAQKLQYVFTNYRVDETLYTGDADAVQREIEDRFKGLNALQRHNAAGESLYIQSADDSWRRSNAGDVRRTIEAFARDIERLIANSDRFRNDESVKMTGLTLAGDLKRYTESIRTLIRRLDD